MTDPFARQRHADQTSRLTWKVLSIPLTTADGLPLPHRDLVLLLTIAVLVITLVVQGFTLAPLVRRAGVAWAPADVRTEEIQARWHLAGTGLAHLEDMSDLEAAPAVVVEGLRRSWLARVERIEAAADESPGDSTAATYRKVRRALLAVEREELHRLFAVGRISDATRRRIQRSLDLEDAGLS